MKLEKMNEMKKLWSKMTKEKGNPGSYIMFDSDGVYVILVDYENTIKYKIFDSINLNLEFPLIPESVEKLLKVKNIYNIVIESDNIIKLYISEKTNIKLVKDPYAASDYDPFSPPDYDYDLNIDLSKFKKFVSKKPHHTSLKNIIFSKENKMVFATDGHHGIYQDHGIKEDLLLPTWIIKLQDNKDKNFSYKVCANVVCVKMKNITIRYKKINGGIPNIREILTFNPPLIKKFETKELKNIITEIKTFIPIYKKENTQLIKYNIKKDIFHDSFESVESVINSENIKSYEINYDIIGYDIKKLDKIIKEIKDPELTWEFNSVPVKVNLIKSKSYNYFIMPLRTKND